MEEERVSDKSRKEDNTGSEQATTPVEQAQLSKDIDEQEDEQDAKNFNLIDKALYNFKPDTPLNFKRDLQYYTIMRERADYARLYTPIVATFVLGILGAVQLILENIEGENLERDNIFNSSQIIISCAAAFITAVCSNVVRESSQKVINYVRLGVEANRNDVASREPITRDNVSFFKDHEINDEKTIEKITGRLFNRI